jgi:hypothetical protein
MNSRTASRIAFHIGRALAGVLLGTLISGVQAFAQTPGTVAPAPAAAVGSSTSSSDIRDIRGPEPIPSPWFWAMGLAGGALVAAGGYGAYRWIRRRKVIATKLPHEIALERLRQARALMRPETVRDFSIAVSDIVRGYIEERFRVMATHRTTEEFLRDLLDPSNPLLTAHRTSLAEFLNHCDLVKFGGWRLSAQNMESMYQAARSFVLITGKPGLTTATHDVARSPADKDIYDSLAST